MGLAAWCGVVGACVLAWPSVAAACGGGGVATRMTSSSSTEGTVADAQRVVISSRANGTTDIVVQVGVSYTSTDYGVLIPVPSEPTIDPDPNLGPTLDELAALTTPTVTVETYVEVPDESDGFGISCGCGSTGAGDKSTRSAGAPTSNEVTVSAPTNIGPITAVSLTASDADAVHGWLATNGFVIPDEQLPVLERYVGQGRYFIAIKRNEGTTNGSPSSVALHYTLAGTYRQLSLGFAQLGAAPIVSFTIFLAASTESQLTGPSLPFETLRLEDLPEDYLSEQDYAGAVLSAVQRHANEAFVAEAFYRVTSSTLGAFKGKILDYSASIARFSTAVRAADLIQDASFDGAFPGAIQNQITVRVQRHARHTHSSAKYASVGWMLAVALARKLRRWRRRGVAPAA